MAMVDHTTIVVVVLDHRALASTTLMTPVIAKASSLAMLILSAEKLTRTHRELTAHQAANRQQSAGSFA